jgi:5-methyltetrahydrofolate--homocysteine methyltransferase
MDRPFLERKRFARAMRKAPTAAERQLWLKLRNRQCHGLRFLRQYVLGNYIADFYCHAYDLVVEVDGRHHESPDVRSCDNSRTENLQENTALRVVRFTNDEVFLLPVEAIYQRIQESVSR